MANVSKYLQAPGTEVDAHEKALSKTDLLQTVRAEGIKSGFLTLFAGLGMGIGLDEAVLKMLSESGKSMSPKENAIRGGIAALSVVATLASIKFIKASDDHENRALELLSGEIGERPVETSAVNPAISPQ